jgi:hypothetical protein
VIASMAAGAASRMLPGMNTLLPSPRIILAALLAVAVVAAAMIASAPSEASQYPSNAKDITLTGKTLAVEQIDVGAPGPSLGDRQILTEDVYRNGKRVGTSDIECTMVRVQMPKFSAQCFNTTTLPGGQITAQGIVTSDELEKVPFEHAVTGGTGAYEGVGGTLTIDEAGDKPAVLTFALRR